MEVKRYVMYYRTETSVSLPIGRYVSEDEAFKDIPNAVQHAWGQIYKDVKCLKVYPKDKYNDYVASVSYIYANERKNGYLIFRLKDVLTEY